MNFSMMINQKMEQENKGDKKLVKKDSETFYKPAAKGANTKCIKPSKKKLSRSPVVKRKKPRLQRMKEVI